MRKKIIRSEEYLEKQRISHLGKPSGFKGKKHTDEAKRKFSRLGWKHSEETKRKIGLKSIGRQHTHETIEKIRKGLSGSNHYNWKGLTPPEILRTCQRPWRALVKKVYERDNYTCQECKKVFLGKSQLNCHHIVPWKISKDDSMENLVTLCRSCHCRIEPRFKKKLTTQNTKVSL